MASDTSFIRKSALLALLFSLTACVSSPYPKYSRTPQKGDAIISGSRAPITDFFSKQAPHAAIVEVDKVAYQGDLFKEPFAVPPGKHQFAVMFMINGGMSWTESFELECQPEHRYRVEGQSTPTSIEAKVLDVTTATMPTVERFFAITKRRATN